MPVIYENPVFWPGSMLFLCFEGIYHCLQIKIAVASTLIWHELRLRRGLFVQYLKEGVCGLHTF